MGVHVYVSAMLRCLQTADPLLRRLGLAASVEPRIMEVPGLCNGDDRLWLDTDIRALFDAGADTRARELLQARRFQRCGLSKREIQARFPWASAFTDFPSDDTQGWWPGCWETLPETAARLNRCVSWLRGLSQELPDEHVVVLFSHGDTIW